MIWIILAVIVLAFLIYGISCAIVGAITGLSYTSSVNQIEEDDIELKHREFWKRQKRNRRR